MIKSTGFVLVAMYLTGCSGYQAMNSVGSSMGYQEAKLSESSYRLRYVGHHGLSNEKEAWLRVDGYWNQRATELCGNDSFNRSEMKKSKPCRIYTTVQSDKVVREKRCLLELTGTLSC